MNATPLAAYGSAPVVEHDPSPRPATPQSLPSLLEAYETSLILAALAATGGHQRRAARILGVGATTLHAKLKRLHLEHTPHLHALPGDSRSGREEFRWRGRLETARAVEVRVVNGDIRIEGCPGVDTVEIVAQKHGRPLGSTPLSVEIDVSQVEAGLSIAARYSNADDATRPDLDANPLRVDLFVRVPADARVDARTINGDVAAAGMAGMLRLESGRGAVRILPSIA